jgi:hypothetical protein
MPLPQYFQPGETENSFYHSVGDRVYGTITVTDKTVGYTFNNGSNDSSGYYYEEKEFGSVSSAQKFASRFAAYMNQCGKRNTVPTLGTFRDFQ